MRHGLAVFQQVKMNLVLMAVAISISFLLIGMMLGIHLWKEVPIGQLTRDPNIVSGVAVYVGFFSQLGIFIWSGTAAICLFSAMILMKGVDGGKMARFLLASGVFTLLLGIDDVFLLHDHVFPSAGLPEKLTYVIYALCALVYFSYFYPVIKQTPCLILASSLFFFSMSITLDVLNPAGLHPYLFEDGAKMIGMVCWMCYLIKVAKTQLQRPGG